MRKILLSIMIAALVLSAASCKKPVEPDKPGYVPPDLSYPGSDNIDTESGDKLPFDTTPATDVLGGDGPEDTEPAATSAGSHNPAVTTPSATEAPDTEHRPETTPQAPTTEPEETESVETELPATEPAVTEDTYVVPDVIIVPTEIPYVITSEAGYHEFIHSPDVDYFSKGVNIYYTVPGEEGVIHMNKLDAYGFMKYIGEYSGSAYDLDIELIEYVISGKLQDELVARKLNPQINFVGGVAVQYGDLPRFIWICTPEDDYFVTFGNNEDEILVCTRDDFFEVLEN